MQTEALGQECSTLIMGFTFLCDVVAVVHWETLMPCLLIFLLEFQFSHKGFSRLNQEEKNIA